jgi:5-formyltetrahydrofolate cyclo-ligase
MMTKAELRLLLRERRSRHVALLRGQGLLEAANAALTTRVIARLGEARVVSAYLSDGEEADPLPILAAAAARGITTALPRVTRRDAPMRFHRWAPGDPLLAGPLRLRQPPPDSAEVEPDLILTPLVGFDRTLARLGQGAAFYDRAFAAHPGARRIGIAWSAQEAELIPTDPWDMPLHAVATELEWIEAP